MTPAAPEAEPLTRAVSPKKSITLVSITTLALRIGHVRRCGESDYPPAGVKAPSLPPPWYRPISRIIFFY